MGAVERYRGKTKARWNLEGCFVATDAEEWNESLRSRARAPWHGIFDLQRRWPDVRGVDESRSSRLEKQPKPTDQEKVSAFNGSFAYCGRYEIDAEKHVLVHLPEVSMTQNYVGTRQIRPFRFEGTRMILADKAKDDPEIDSWEVVWEKVK
jgi:hypothetical protein